MEILNRGNDLFVTFTNLIKSDANTYYCGVERNGPDPLIKVNLKVTDATSYCPKRTPDTVDTFTTLSSAVSNISTLSSNNKHNITDVSASNTTLNTPTHSAPATQAAGSVPYLIAGLICTFALVMVVLLLTRKLMKRGQRGLDASSPHEDIYNSARPDEVYQSLHPLTMDEDQVYSSLTEGYVLRSQENSRNSGHIYNSVISSVKHLHSEAEYDEIRHEEATDPDSLYANNSFLQDIGSAAAGCETNSRGACAASRDNVLASHQSRRSLTASGLQQDFKPLSTMNRRTQQEMEEIEEQEDDYVNASKGAVDEKRTRPGRRFVLPIAVCWLILLAIMGLRIYLTSELSGNNAELYSRIQELETWKNNLTQQIQDMTTNWNELNVSRAQWSIDSYCLGNTDKKCQPCQRGWGLIQPSCYGINNPPSPGWKTWAEAQEDCSGKNSNLSVPHNLEAANNTDSYRGDRYWIGLRVVNKQWKWVDGSNLTDSSRIAAPDPADGHCAVFYNGNNWYSASCEEKQRWICKKKALSV
ncbi:hypothetical protein NQZ68_020099 [Dissostichus eleginoides]|nr:hypothetical protein NQZ68_020099 [Dissostichus eleginoides]